MPVFRVVFACCILLLSSGLPADAHNCRCRNRGDMYNLGQTSCLRVDGKSYLARCEMKLNVSSWTKVQDGCPISMRTTK